MFENKSQRDDGMNHLMAESTSLGENQIVEVVTESATKCDKPAPGNPDHKNTADNSPATSSPDTKWGLPLLEAEFKAECEKARCMYRDLETANPQTDIFEFLKARRFKQRMVRVPKVLIRLLRSLPNSIVMAQMAFWLLGKGKDGRPRANPSDATRNLMKPWITMSARQLSKQTGLTSNQIHKAMRELKARGWLAFHPMRRRFPNGFRGRVARHIWIGDKLPENLRTDLGVKMSGGILIHRVWAMAAANYDLNSALLLSRLWYLLYEKRVSEEHFSQSPLSGFEADGRWIYSSYEDFARWSGLSVHQVKRAMARLKRMGLVRTRRHRRGHLVCNVVSLSVELCVGFILMCQVSQNPARQHSQSTESLPSKMRLRIERPGHQVGAFRPIQ